MRVYEGDMPLIRAFIDREAQDFGGKDDKWCEQVMNLVIEQSNKISEEEADYLYITSYYNVGLVNRELRLSVRTDKVDYKKAKDYEIMLCPCGKLNHTCVLSERTTR